MLPADHVMNHLIGQWSKLPCPLWSFFSTAQWSPPPWSPAHPMHPASPRRPRCSSSWTESPTRVTAPPPTTARQRMRMRSLIKVTSCWSTWRTLSSSLPTRRSWLNTTQESHWHSSSTWVTLLRQEVQIGASLLCCFPDKSSKCSPSLENVCSSQCCPPLIGWVLLISTLYCMVCKSSSLQ